MPIRRFLELADIATRRLNSSIILPQIDEDPHALSKQDSLGQTPLHSIAHATVCDNQLLMDRCPPEVLLCAIALVDVRHFIVHALGLDCG
jgi:hypothetical protein